MAEYAVRPVIPEASKENPYPVIPEASTKMLIEKPLVEDEPLTMKEVFHNGVISAVQHPKAFAALSATTMMAGAKAGAVVCGGNPICVAASSTAGLLAPAALAVTASAVKAITSEPADFRYENKLDEKEFRENSAFDQSFAEGLTSGTVRASKQSTAGNIIGNMTGTLLLARAVSPLAAVDESMKIKKPVEAAVKSSLPFGIGMSIQSTVESVNESLDLDRSAEDTAAMATIRFFSTIAGNSVGFGIVPVTSTLFVNRFFANKVFSPFTARMGQKLVSGAEFSAYGTTERLTEYITGKVYDDITNKDLYSDASISLSDSALEFGMGVAFKTGTQTMSGFMSTIGRKAFDKVSQKIESTVEAKKKKADISRSAKINSIYTTIETEFRLGDMMLFDKKMSPEMETDLVTRLKAEMKTASNKEQAFKDFINRSLDTEYWGEKNIKKLINSVWF